MPIKIIAIAAMDQGRVIGRDNQLPWRVPEDMKRFSQLTTGHAVLMGRKTFDSLPTKYRPLPNRKNIVLSRQVDVMLPAEVTVWADAASHLKQSVLEGVVPMGKHLWVIGGEQIYNLTMPYWDEVYLTVVFGEHDGDAFFPEFESAFRLVEEEQGASCLFRHYVRTQSE